MVPSSSGLGHRPLTAVTRVRVPLGSPINPNPPFGGFGFIGDLAGLSNSDYYFALLR